ncbi:MAG: SusC/RagA family TonB-linked outer membrane protein [Lachnospiraceae bacterium]|nr:SusC/RagA family TonB-linked outer membrane protein [Lachnospiraceae bacterium]
METYQKIGKPDIREGALKWLGRVIAVLCLLMMPALVFAATKGKVTLRLNDAPMIEALEKVEEQTDYKLSFSHDEVAHYRVTCNIKDKSVKDALKEIFKATPLTFEIEKEFITIFRSNRTDGQLALLRNSTAIGEVLDRDGNPLVGVTVMTPDGKHGTATDTDGKFRVTLPAGNSGKLVFSYIGMKKATALWSGMPLHIVMNDDETTLDDVVVTGYQTIDRRKLTSAITSVKAEDIYRPDATSIDAMLEGRIPDLMFTSNSGEVGTVPRLRIRGTSTLIGNREPLWVVDGIVLQDPVNVSPEELNNPDYVNRIGNAISGINPQDIDRIDVLKDASATALYGAKAANGVIVITTKKGHEGKAVVRYSGQVTYKLRPRYTDSKINLMNSQERIDFSRDLFNNGYRFGQNTNMIGYEGLLKQYYQGEIDYATFVGETQRLERVNTDWFDILTRDAISTSHTASLSGGNSNMRYYASLGYTNEEDVIRGNSNKRYTASMKLDANLSRIFSVQLNILGNVNNRDYVMDEINPLNYAYNTSRAIPAYDEDGELYYYKKGATPINSYNYNVLNEIANSSNKQRSQSLNVSAIVNARFTDWLKASVIGNIQSSTTNMEQWWGEKSNHVAILRTSEYGVNPPTGTNSKSELPFGGELTTNNVRSNSYMVRAQLDFNKYIGSTNRHNISASVGFEMNSTQYDANLNTERGYYKDRGKQFTSIELSDYPDYAKWLEKNFPTITDNRTNLLSAYATVSYNFRDLFTVNANARVDGSNKFGDRSNDKLLPIWSVSANYNISEHPFLRHEWIDIVMLKFSYGYQGNMLENQSPQMIIQQKPMDTLYGEMVSNLAVYPNPKLRWEKTSSFNAGLEFSLFNRRLQFEGSVFHKKTSDAFLLKDISSVNGVTQYVVNSGDITNYGYSAAITAVPVRIRDFNWILSTSVSKIFNKVKTLPGQEQYELDDFLNGTALIEGAPIGTFYSYKFKGLDPTNGSAIFDTMEDRQDELAGLTKYEFYTSILEKSGSREPTISGSINNTFTYKNWRLNLLLNYSLGSKVRLLKLYGSSFDPANNVNREFVNHWRYPGDEKFTDIPAPGDVDFPWSTGHGNFPAVGYDSWSMYNYGNQRVVSGDYLKIAMISLTYEFPTVLTNKLRLSRLALSCTANNLHTFCSSRLKGQTPQQSGFSEVQLTDRPSFTMGLDISF